MNSETRPTVLIVDDIALNIQVLANTLKEDYHLLVATNGHKALEIARLQPQPDLILMDVMMPEMDGYEACERLKADELTRDIPVIFVTARNEVENEKRGLAMGAVDYISKPFHTDIVKARVYTHVSLKLKTDMLNRMVKQDGLTGIANRRAFDETLKREWSRAERTSTALSLLMIDVDHFKLYNDHYGHVAGDDCLRKVATAMQEGMLRASDLLARYGGEEFAVILPGIEYEGVVAVAKRLHQVVGELHLAHEFSSAGPYVSVSIGCAIVYPGQQGYGDATLLVKAADESLYRAKQEGRNQVYCCNGAEHIKVA